MFKPEYIELTYSENRDVFRNISNIDKKRVSLLLKEIIIIDLLINYVDGEFFTTEEIQNAYFDFFMKHQDSLPSYFFEFPPSTPNKNRIKTILINITSSNSQNINGLSNRNEVILVKNDKDKYIIKASENLVNFFDFPKNHSITKSIEFMECFSYITNYFQLIHGELPRSQNIGGKRCGTCLNVNGYIILFRDTPDSDNLLSFTPLNTRHVCKSCLEKELKGLIYHVQY